MNEPIGNVRSNDLASGGITERLLNGQEYNCYRSKVCTSSSAEHGRLATGNCGGSDLLLSWRPVMSWQKQPMIN